MHRLRILESGPGFVLAVGAFMAIIGVGLMNYEGTRVEANKSPWPHPLFYCGVGLLIVGFLAAAAAVVLFIREHRSTPTSEETASGPPLVTGAEPLHHLSGRKLEEETITRRYR